MMTVEMQPSTLARREVMEDVEEGGEEAGEGEEELTYDAWRALSTD
jgi:hypothetical protein